MLAAGWLLVGCCCCCSWGLSRITSCRYLRMSGPLGILFWPAALLQAGCASEGKVSIPLRTSFESQNRHRDQEQKNRNARLSRKSHFEFSSFLEGRSVEAPKQFIIYVFYILFTMFYAMCVQKAQVFTHFPASLPKPEIASSELSSKPLRTYANIFVNLDIEMLPCTVKFQYASCTTHTFKRNVSKTQYF